MLPSHSRGRWRPAFTTAVSAALLAAVAGWAGTPSHQAGGAVSSTVAAGTTTTTTGCPWPAPLGAASIGPSSSAPPAGTAPRRPRLVVVYLGTNDFSTAVNPGEPWTADGLVTAYRNAYGDFVQKLRTRYGAKTTIVAVGAGSFANYVQQVVQQRNAAGDSRVRYWLLDGGGLDSSGCHYHFSTHDDRLIADRLSAFIGSLPMGW